MSDESQKLFGLIILLPFLEILNYLSNYYYSEIKEIINTKNNDDYIDENQNDISKSINDAENKNKNIKNLYIYYVIFYIIIQEMFIMANQNSFSLMKYSFGFEIDKVQQQKALYILKFLKPFFGNFSYYRYSLIILGFYLEKEIYDNNEKNYSLDFIIRKILINFGINTDTIYLFYQMLITINDKYLVDLLIHLIVNFSLFIFDYIGFGLIKFCHKIFS